MTSYKEAYKYPFIATEILSSKNKLITDKILINYIKENPECPLEDIINDDEFLDLLKYNNNTVYL